jgi:hypothetical protein
MLTDDGYRQLMKHAKRLAQEGHGELAQHLRDAIDLRAEVEALKAENERQFTALNDWLYANGPNGWIEKLRVAVEDLTADRDSWIEQASARTADAVQFMQERDAARAEVEALRADAERLDCGQIMIDTRDEFGEPKQVWHTGMNLRAAIDAARAAQGGRG